jgi:hypothetical protein
MVIVGLSVLCLDIKACPAEERGCSAMQCNAAVEARRAEGMGKSASHQHHDPAWRSHEIGA